VGTYAKVDPYVFCYGDTAWTFPLLRVGRNAAARNVAIWLGKRVGKLLKAEREFAHSHWQPWVRGANQLSIMARRAETTTALDSSTT